ncbi:hypothetical protein WS52_00545 [Burkholderia territorii]|nr:hypothetical protein WS52_00545 [Burkholderia territorii]KUZ51776.1 hypothetical protein WS53_19120 [Burkholderia territorii]
MSSAKNLLDQQRNGVAYPPSAKHSRSAIPHAFRRVTERAPQGLHGIGTSEFRQREHGPFANCRIGLLKRRAKYAGATAYGSSQRPVQRTRDIRFLFLEQCVGDERCKRRIAGRGVKRSTLSLRRMHRLESFQQMHDLKHF